jgi:predicted permease
VSGVLAETTLMTLGGGLLGLAVGAAGIRLLAALGTDRLPLGAHVVFDARLAAVALAGSLLLGVLIGLPIAGYSLRGRAAEGMLFASRGGTAGRAAQRLRHGFIVAQIALAFVLLAGAGLLGLSLRQVMALSPGFRAEGILTGRISLPGKGYPDRAALLAFTERLAERLAHEPGMVAAGVATNVPLSGTSNKSAATLAGHRPGAGEPPHAIYSYSVGGDYFRAMGLTLREGRFLTAADSRRAERVCVVDEDFARRYWPQGGPRGRALGQRLFEGSEEGPAAEAYTVVGVVAPVKQEGLTENGAQGAVYYPFGHRADRNVFVVLRTRVPAESLGGNLQSIVREIDPELPVNDLRSMEGRVADSLIARRSLLLTAIGTYGVLSYAVAQRRREIGLRMALGARPEQVRAQFVGIALRLLAAGLLFGGIGAWLPRRAMQTVLFQVPAMPVAVLVGAAVILGSVALVACLQPAERAARISPLEALAED